MSNKSRALARRETVHQDRENSSHRHDLTPCRHTHIAGGAQQPRPRFGGDWMAVSRRWSGIASTEPNSDMALDTYDPRHPADGPFDFDARHFAADRAMQMRDPALHHHVNARDIEFLLRRSEPAADAVGQNVIGNSRWLASRQSVADPVQPAP